MKNLKGWILSVVAALGIIGTFIALSGTITDYAKMPGRMARMEAKIDTLANNAQDLQLLVCIQMAELEGESGVECVENWRTREKE